MDGYGFQRGSDDSSMETTAPRAAGGNRCAAMGTFSERPRDESFTCYLVQDPVIKNTITKQLLPMFLAWLYLEADVLAVKSPLEWIQEKGCNGQGRRPFQALPLAKLKLNPSHWIFIWIKCQFWEAHQQDGEVVTWGNSCLLFWGKKCSLVIQRKQLVKKSKMWHLQYRNCPVETRPPDTGKKTGELFWRRNAVNMDTNWVK